ncbi:hypothetical protein Pmani_001610 [Petrolisthes manimaculis]|uniref:ABC transporter domain-containing protein n=1 Tax=Petrolisthes manimaculis TaxID=1843537 RepID=A0AAE1URU1_9EUCA|nr:hypothetical protein Pmani_001610 [Petrolisthes manimaculis]
MPTKSSQETSGQNSRRKKRNMWRKLGLLMWKILLLRKRHWLLTAFEIILPSLLFVLLLTIRMIPDSDFAPEYINETSTFNVADEFLLRRELCSKYGAWVDDECSAWPVLAPGNRKFFYGPPTNFTTRVAHHVAASLGLEVEDMVEAVKTNEEMDRMVQKAFVESSDSLASFYMGLYFHDLPDEDQDLPPDHLSYDLRLLKYWFTNQIYPFLQIPGPRNFTTTLSDNYASYGMDGFSLIQSIVDRYFIYEVTENTSYTTDYQFQTQMYPYPPYIQDRGMSQFYGASLPTFVVISLVLLSPSLIKSIVYEKETGVRELTRLMGMDRWLVWLCWFFHSFFIILIVITIMTLMVKLELPSQDNNSGDMLPPIIISTDPMFIWVLLLLYGISSITFCFFIATLFSRPTLATTLGIVIWLTSYFIPRTLMDYEYDTMGLAPKILSCLLPNMAITWAFRIIAMFEGRGVGVQWNHLWETGNPRDQLTPAMVLLMLSVDIILYLLITWYVDQVNPGLFGVPEPWYFPFQKKYWCGSKPEDSLTEGVHHQRNESYFEKDPEGLTPGIVVKNLKKEFKNLTGKVTTAVKNVSMTCYEGQCTVLLGHNGAGKTTTMSILTGVYAPSGGAAEVGGWNIATHLKEAREELGLCPQHNMLFVDLTVLQHLLFFGRLKGMTSKEARTEAEELMLKLDLMEKKHRYGNQLSGGMKRKLCLAIALIGGSKVVILDEPSSGLDPESRRWVWQVVQGERGRRTVLVTTHHMEEADVLGDRVAIMSSGRVVCAGSTLFLKNKFGDGYTLTVMVSNNSSVTQIQKRVQEHLPQSVLRSAQGGEVTFKLPPTTAQFAPLLDTLTKQKDQLGIRHVGLSLTSMEQVFLRVGEIKEEDEETNLQWNPGTLSSNKNLQGSQNLNCNQDGSQIQIDNLNGSQILQDHMSNGNECSSQRYLFNSQSNIDGLLSGLLLLSQRLKAFFIKRAIYFKRKWLLLISQGLLPVLVTVLCILVDGAFIPDTRQEPPRSLNLTMFPFTSSYVYAESDLMGLASAYESLFWDDYKVNFTSNVEDSLLAEAEQELNLYRENSICSAEFLNNGSTTAMLMSYQSIPYHPPGIGTSLITNALLRYATNSSSYSISTTNRPLPPDQTWRVGNTNTSFSALMYSMMMPLALAFLSASFLVFPLHERETKAKQVQIMTGAPVWALWVTNFLWDYLTYLVSAILIFLVLVLFDSKDYFSAQAAPGALILLLLLYGWASIPMAYVFSFPFQTAAAGFAVLALINIVAGQILTTAVWALDASNQPKLATASDVLGWISSVVPTYVSSMGFQHLIDTSIYNTQCDILDKDTKESVCDALSIFSQKNPFIMCCPQCADVGDRICFQKKSYFLLDDLGMARDFLTLVVNGFIFIIILVLIELQVLNIIRFWVKNLCFKKNIKVTASVGKQDEDVIAEAELVDAMIKGEQESDTTALLVSGLSKSFFSAPRPAVNNVSFRVGRGECLGLLGVNGAGKTTTFRMLTGDEQPSAGNAKINNVSLRDDPRRFVQQIGYCPQFDAVLGELTGTEMLILMARLRGVIENQIKNSVNSLVNLVGLTECADRPSSTYSGGNRRKLSTAMALVGNPPLVFLDEPTSGVDPASRRRVWAAVSQAVSRGQSVVLTSHSMEECEALCSRIIIMAQGTLRCVGTTMHLKAKYGQGCSLQIKLKNDPCQPHEEALVSQLKKVISQSLHGASLTDEHKGMLAYQVPTTVSWGHLFSVMERLKQGDANNGADVNNSSTSISLVEDYAASDTSLEQVFLSFAREAAITDGSPEITIL